MAAEENEGNDVDAAEDGNGDSDNVEDVNDDQNVPTNKHSGSDNAVSNLKRHLNYSLAKQAPYQNITVDKIILKFGTLDFISALTTFLR